MKHIFTLLLSFYLPALLSAQSLTGISPTQAMQGQSLSVAITGQNTAFAQGSSTTSAWLQQGGSVILFTTMNVVNNVLISGSIDVQNSDPAGLYNVEVYNTIDGQLSITNGFEVLLDPNPPIIITVHPDTGYTGDINLAVTITGQNTHFAQGSNTVWFTQGTSTVLYPFNMNPTSDTETTGYFNIPTNQPTGLYNVHVYDDPDGELIKPLAFNILAGGIGFETIVQAVLKFEAYPNPLAETLTLDFELDAEEHVYIDLYDLTGKQLTVFLDTRFSQGKHTKQVQLSNLNIDAGVYFVRMRSGSKERNLKVVKK
jgi:hypothetical protein